LKRVWGDGICYGFFLKNILMLNFQEKNIFARKKYFDARFSPIKIAFF